MFQKYSKIFFRRSITGEEAYLGVLNKLLTHIHNIHTLHKEIIVENLVQRVLFTHRGPGGEDRKKFYKIYLSITKVSQNKSDKHGEVMYWRNIEL